MFCNVFKSAVKYISVKGKDEMISSSGITMYLHSEGCMLSRHVISMSAGTRLRAAMMRRVEGWRQCVVHRSPAPATQPSKTIAVRV